MMKNELPKFSSEKELAEWIGGHDTSEYMDDLEAVAEEIPVRRTPLVNETLGLLLNPTELAAIKRIAERKGVPYRTLIQTWLIEKLQQEGPDVLSKT
jgi:predicted DNA binding CopG/RHH family protein